jgi:hypothetical protein
MNHRLVAIVGAAVAVAMAAPAAQAAPRKATVTPTAKAAWNGTTAVGLNGTWFTDSLRPSGACGKDTQNYCDDTLVHFTSTTAPADSYLTFRIDGFQPVSDFDLRVYLADSTGEPIEYLGSPTGDVTKTSPAGSDDPRNTWIGDYESKTVNALPGDYYLVRVVYFTVANDAYKGSVTWSGTAPAAAASSSKAKRHRARR